MADLGCDAYSCTSRGDRFCLPFPGCLAGSMRCGLMGLRAPGVGSRRFFWLLFPTLSISCLVSFQVAWFRLPLTGGWLT